MLSFTISKKSRLSACLLLAVLAAGCSKQEQQPPATDTPAATAATQTAAPPAQAVAASVQAMGADQLRDSATRALRENRMYAPAGDNAMEYYLALRDKLPDDAVVASALTDLMPYTVIAAEQAVVREQFDEAQRLTALIEKTDATAPALPRIRQSIASSQQAVAQRSQAEQQRASAQQAAEAETARRLAAEAESARQAAAERQAAEQRDAEQRAATARQAAAAPPPRPAAVQQPTLRPISMPAPRYPPEALRAGTSGEVLVEFTVGTDGAVTDARVLRANPSRVFDREALNAVRRWRFEPLDAPITTRRTVAFSNGG